MDSRTLHDSRLDAQLDARDTATLLRDARAAIADRIDHVHKAFGVVAIVVDASGTHVIRHGRMSRDDARVPDAETVFELGSIVKVFDALLLCEMAERGDVGLDDPVAIYLPPDVRVPQRGRAITFAHLATHTSGLPGRQTNPAADRASASADQVFAFLERCTPTRDAGAYYEYSNLGAALLRQALATRAGLDYATLLRTRVGEPLGMRSLCFAPTTDIASRMAAGHDDRLNPVPMNPIELRATAADLGRFLASCVGGAAAPLRAALDRLLSVRVPCGSRVDAALGWNVESQGQDEIVCHDGVTWGFRTWIGYRPSIGRGLAILANAATAGGLLDVGYHLLDEAYPLFEADSPFLQPPAAPTAIALPIELLDRYAGQYQLTPNVVITITRQDDRLLAEKPGQPRIAIDAESPVTFFSREVDFFSLPADTRLTFKVDADGNVAGLTLCQRGHDVWLPRVVGDGARVWFGHAAAPVDRSRLARYVGTYSLGSSTLVVTTDGARLLGEFDNGLAVELVPEREAAFFIENDVMDVHLVFEVDDTGCACAVSGAFDGHRRRGVRIGDAAARRGRA